MEKETVMTIREICFYDDKIAGLFELERLII